MLVVDSIFCSVKIVQINKLYAPWIGGVESHVQQLAEQLALSYSVSVLCCSPNSVGESTILNGVHVDRQPSFGIHLGMPISLAFVRAMRRIIADILHFHLPNPLAVMAYLLWRPKGRIVVTWHSDIIRQKWIMIIYRPFLMRFLRQVDRIIVTSPQMKQNSPYLQEFQDKISVIPLSLDLTQYTPRTPQTLPKSPYYLFVGRLVPYKGCFVLLHAIAKTNHNLIMIGDGPLKPDIEAFIQRHNLSNRIQVLPPQSGHELHDYYNNCQGFVLPSIHPSEAFGIVQLEAMAYAKPVISTQLPTGVSFVNQNGRTGITVPPHDIDALATALDDLLTYPEYGPAARQRVVSEFSLPTMMQRIIDLYTTI